MTAEPSPDLQTLTQELPLPDEAQLTGSVRWFNDAKGYGFITPDDGGEDVFVRFSSIEQDGFRALEPGQRVTFARTTDARGPRASWVRAE